MTTLDNSKLKRILATSGWEEFIPVSVAQTIWKAAQAEQREETIKLFNGNSDYSGFEIAAAIRESGK